MIWCGWTLLDFAVRCSVHILPSNLSHVWPPTTCRIRESIGNSSSKSVLPVASFAFPALRWDRHSPLFGIYKKLSLSYGNQCQTAHWSRDFLLIPTVHTQTGSQYLSSFHVCLRLIVVWGNKIRQYCVRYALLVYSKGLVYGCKNAVQTQVTWQQFWIRSGRQSDSTCCG